MVHFFLFFVFLMLFVSPTVHAIHLCVKSVPTEESAEIDRAIEDEILQRLLQNGIRSQQDIEEAFRALTAISPYWRELLEPVQKRSRLIRDGIPGIGNQVDALRDALILEPTTVDILVATDSTAAQSFISFAEQILFAKIKVPLSTVDPKHPDMLLLGRLLFDRALYAQHQRSAAVHDLLIKLLHAFGRHLRKRNSVLSENIDYFTQYAEEERAKYFYPQLKDYWFLPSDLIDLRTSTFLAILMQRISTFADDQAKFPDDLRSMNELVKAYCSSAHHHLLDQALQKIVQADDQAIILYDWLGGVDLPPRTKDEYRRARVLLPEKLEPPANQIKIFQGALEKLDEAISRYLEIIDSIYGLKLPPEDSAKPKQSP